MPKKKRYKEPVFLFTSSSMRKAAWAGWYSALGEKDKAEDFVHQAYAEWSKEVSAGRKYSFADRYSNDIYFKIDFEKLKCLTDKYLKDLRREIKKTEIIKGNSK